MTDYTPTMGDMIECVCGEGAQGYTREEFNRFIASVKAEALMEAADAAFKDKSIQGLARVTVGNWNRNRAAKIARAPK